MGIYIIYVLQSPLMHICITDHSSANRSITVHGDSSHELPAGFSLYWSSYDGKKLAITDKSQTEDGVPVKAALAGWKHTEIKPHAQSPKKCSAYVHANSVHRNKQRWFFTYTFKCIQFPDLESPVAFHLLAATPCCFHALQLLPP